MGSNPTLSATAPGPLRARPAANLLPRKSPVMELVDSHHHLWWIDISELNWLTDEMRAGGGATITDFDLAQMEETFATVGVSRSVLIEAWHAEADQIHWLKDTSDHPIVGAVIAWAPLESPELRRHLDRFCGYPKFRGLRVSPENDPDPDFLQRPDIRAGVAQLAEREGLTLDLLVKLSDLKDVPDLCASFPNLPMVLDHLAKPQTYQDGYFEAWSELMLPLIDLPNLQFKLSGMLTEAGPEPTAPQLARPVRFMLEKFGPARLMWGSDWPVCLNAAGYRENFALMQAAIGPLAKAEREALFGGNAAAHYRLADWPGKPQNS